MAQADARLDPLNLHQVCCPGVAIESDDDQSGWSLCLKSIVEQLERVSGGSTGGSFFVSYRVRNYHVG